MGMKFFKKIAKKQLISETVIISVVFGLAAGIVGQILADVYINPWRQDYVSQQFEVNQGISNLTPELQKVKKFLGIQQDFEVSNSVLKAAPSLVGIYQKKKPSSEILNQIYLTQDLLGNGFILTSDGWLVSHGSVISSLDSKQLVVAHGNTTYSVERAVTDSVTGIVFLKISADNLPVALLGDSGENSYGQLAIALNFLKEVAVTNIKNPGYQSGNKPQDFILSSEKYPDLILLENNLADSYLGAPLLNLVGEVTGVVSEISSDNKVITAVPISQFRPIILSILRDNLIKRPYLGINYINLAKAVGIDSTITGKLGALVYQNSVKLSPAAAADLKSGDIIVAVEGQTVNADNNLTALVQQYQPGDELTFEIIRDKKTIEKKIILSVQPE